MQALNANRGDPMTDALLLCDDLIFVSRITGTAKALGLNVRAVKTAGRAAASSRSKRRRAA